MRVFVTGATGYIGSAIVTRLLSGAHEVAGLARSSRAAERLAAQGVEAVAGDLGDPAHLARVVAGYDAVVHAGFNHDDWAAMDKAFAQDEAAVSAMLGALAGSGRPFVYTSGSGVLDDTGPTARDETAALSRAPLMATRIRVEQEVVDAAGRGVRGIVIRPGLVHGAGGGATLNLLLDLAARPGGPYTVGAGWNVWSAVHRDDLAGLVALAVDHAPGGSVFHAADADRVTMREIAAAGGRAAGRFGPVRTIPVEEARGIAGDMADSLVTDKRISAQHARTALGWIPRGPSIIEEIERGSSAPQPGNAAGTGSPADVGLTMINNFEVPAAAADRFLADWSSDLEFMRRQAGFVSGTLYRADPDNARFRYVNVAHWARHEDFAAARAAIGRRATGGTDRVGDWTALGIRMTPATYTTQKRF